VTVKSVTLQRDGESDSTNFTSLYGREVCVSKVPEFCELIGDSVNSAVPDGEVSYGKFLVYGTLCKVIYG